MRATYFGLFLAPQPDNLLLQSVSRLRKAFCVGDLFYLFIRLNFSGNSYVSVSLMLRVRVLVGLLNQSRELYTN